MSFERVLGFAERVLRAISAERDATRKCKTGKYFDHAGPLNDLTLNSGGSKEQVNKNFPLTGRDHPDGG